MTRLALLNVWDREGTQDRAEERRWYAKEAVLGNRYANQQLEA
jgi:hypothetical protein